MSSLNSTQKLETQELYISEKPSVTHPLLNDSSQNFSVNPHGSFQKLKKVIYMGFAFFLLFTAFMSASNLVAEIYSQLGFTSLGNLTSLVLYSVFWGALFVIPGMIKDWSYKFGVLIGSLGYFFTLIAGVMTTSCGISSNTNAFWCTQGCIYAVNLICAAINGFTAPILWLSVNRYVTGCTNAKNKGKYLGLFSSFVTAAQIMGNILSAFVIKYFGQFTFYLIASAFVVAAIVLIFFSANVAKYDKGTIVESIPEKTKKVLKLAVSPRMRPFLLFCFFVGFVLAVSQGFEYKIITNIIPDQSKTEKDYQTALIFIVQGTAGVTASYTAGRLADIMKLKLVLFIFNSLTFIAIVLSFVCNSINSMALCYVMGLFLGMGYNGALTLTDVVMAKDFDGTLESFSVVQLISAMATITGFGLSFALGDHINTFLGIIMGLFIITQISTFLYKSKSSS